MKVVKINDALLKAIEWGGIPQYRREIGFRKVGERVYRLDIQGDEDTDLSRKFIVIYFEVTKSEPPSNVKVYYSHTEHEERQSKQVRWRIVRKSFQPLDGFLRRRIMAAVIWTWGRYSLDTDAHSWPGVKHMNPENGGSQDCDEESTRTLQMAAPKFFCS